MPFLDHADYRPPRWFRNPHINSIYAALARRVPDLPYRRERLTTPDGDFLDLDWSRVGGDRLVVVLHGLEGSADRPYVRGMIRRFNQAGWDGLALNFRSCSGEMNRRLRTYHMGETSDLEFALQQVVQPLGYREVGLIGFSLGGNVALRYVESRGSDALVSAAVVFSVPCDIPTANVEIDRWQNTLYLRRFLGSLNRKMRLKAQRFPEEMPEAHPPARTFREFDDRFTAPIHGFRDAMDYWTRCSSVHDLEAIRVPTLLVNALDDTFLSAACFPVAPAKASSFFHLQTPRWGGHVGFARSKGGGVYWSEDRALTFLEQGK